MAIDFVLESTISILCFLLLILIVNLYTFKRLHPVQQAKTGPQDSQDYLAQSARGQPMREFAVVHEEDAYGDHRGSPFRCSSCNGVEVQDDGATRPLVSILVPARNEENCIEACVRSLVDQDYESLEVLVLDDQSSDATASIVQHLIDELPESQRARLRLLKGRELPTGWIGKNFACQQLTEQAQGTYLLFTDADTVHTPQMLQTVLECMQQERVQLLTGQPEQMLGSVGERLIVPLLNFTILTLLPVALIGRRPEPSLATGNGQLLCFQRAAYEEIGGHAAMRDRILEDVLLARKIKAAGYTMIFVDALELVHCRMYHSWREVWSGFSKNLFAFYNYSLPFALFALALNLLLFVLPALLLLGAPFLAMPLHTLFYAFVAYALAILMRGLLTLRFVRVRRGLMLLYSVLHPLSILLECLILVNAIRWRYRKAGTMWKGRQYL